jgi:hypothetical protein
MMGNKKRYIPAGVYLFVLFCPNQRGISFMAGSRKGKMAFPVLLVKNDKLFKEPGCCVQILSNGWWAQ